MAKKKQISNKPKRKINSGLKAWNDARSFFSKQNKAAGKKYNGVELNALTKSFLFEHYGGSFDSKDLEQFIKVEDMRKAYIQIMTIVILT
jgi:hypothetical protein